MEIILEWLNEELIKRSHQKGKKMFNMFEFKIPTYKEWKVQLEKLIEEQPEQAKKYQEQVQKFWKDFFEDMFKIK